MSDQPELLRQLQRLTTGDREVLQEVLLSLAGSAVLVPVLTPQVVAFETGLNFIDVLTLTYDDRRLVPLFTDTEFFSDWAAGRYDALHLTGADLALSVPLGTSLFINPGTHENFELTPEKVVQLSSFAGDDSILELLPPECGTVTRPDAPPTGRLERDLSEVLSAYEEVQEGYFLPAANYPTSGIIGLVTRDFTEERRLQLLAEIGEISQRFFAETTALEIFDEADGRSSSVWDLFLAVPPFYSSIIFADEASGGNRTGNGASGQKNGPFSIKSFVHRLWGNSGA